MGGLGKPARKREERKEERDRKEEKEKKKKHRERRKEERRRGGKGTEEREREENQPGTWLLHPHPTPNRALWRVVGVAIRDATNHQPRDSHTRVIET